MHINTLHFRIPFILLFTAMIQSVHGADTLGQSEIPANASPRPELSRKGSSVYLAGNTLWLKLDGNAMKTRKVVIPRLCAPIRSIGWRGQPDAELKIRPAQQEWTFTWKTVPSDASVIEIVFDSKPFLPANCPVAVPAGDGSVMLQAWQAKTFGEKILFEPQWYKNTVGYWAVESDYATWELKIEQPGTYSIAVLQGCGKGQGGSDASITLQRGNEVKAELAFRTIDTGHFQNFRWNDLGNVKLSEAGRYQLRIDAKRIAKVALFDVRTIHLVRQATESPE